MRTVKINKSDIIAAILDATAKTYALQEPRPNAERWAPVAAALEQTEADKDFRLVVSAVIKAITGEDVEFASEIRRLLPFVPGAAAVVTSDYGDHNYPVGSVTVCKSYDRDGDAFGLREDGVQGNYLRLNAATRAATEDEIRAFADKVGVKRIVEFMPELFGLKVEIED